MGKSRLLEEARVRASDLGLRVLAARATELEQGFPIAGGRQRRARALAGGSGRWPRTCSPERRRRRLRGPPPGPAAGDPGYGGNTACKGSPRTSPLIRRTHNESTASGRPDHGSRGSTSPALAGVLPRHTGPCRRPISDACQRFESLQMPANTCLQRYPRRTAPPVRFQSPATQTHNPTDDDLQTQAFSEAADGIRTHDLLHGKQSVLRRFHREYACKQAVPGHPGPTEGFPAFTGKSRGFG